jgi:hypothetical protein
MKAADQPKHGTFVDFMLIETDGNNGYLHWVMFEDEAMFHIYSCRIWSSQQLNKFFEYGAYGSVVG